MDTDGKSNGREFPRNLLADLIPCPIRVYPRSINFQTPQSEEGGLGTPPAGQRDGDSGDDRDGSTDDQPHGTIGGVACECAGNIGGELMRFVESKNQKHDAQRQNCETYNCVHGMSFCFQHSIAPTAAPANRELPGPVNSFSSSSFSSNRARDEDETGCIRTGGPMR